MRFLARFIALGFFALCAATPAVGMCKPEQWLAAPPAITEAVPSRHAAFVPGKPDAGWKRLTVVPASEPRAGRGESFLWGGYAAYGAVDTDFSNGFHFLASPRSRFGSSFPLFGQTVMIQGDFALQSYRYGAKQLTSGSGVTYRSTAGIYREDVEEGRVGVRISREPIYVGFDTLYVSPPAPLSRQPDLVGTGIGLEALPNFWRARSVFGKFYWFPKVEAEDTLPYYLRYVRFSYEIGIARRIGRGKSFFTVSLRGDDRRAGATLAPNVPQVSHLLTLDTGYAVRL
jgi:hypothetical protein